MYGLSWLHESWKYIQEDKAQHYRWMMLAAPLGKTPTDRKGGQALNSYSKKLDNVLDNMTPWTGDSRYTSLRRQYGKQMRESDSQIIVTLDGSDDPTSSLFKDATTTTSRKRKAGKK